MPAKAALFISVDGIDGVGKSTQIQRLVELLGQLGLRCIATRDPGTSEIGQRLRSLLLDSDLKMHRRTEAMLFMASRCEMIEQTIKPALAAGTSVISDRFLLANVVYQSTGADSGQTGSGPAESAPAELGLGADQTEVSPELLWKLGTLANDGLRPDLTILLDMPAAAAMNRIDGPADRMESRGVEYMERVRQSFLANLSQASDATVVINADQTPDEVAADIRNAVERHLSDSN